MDRSTLLLNMFEERCPDNDSETTMPELQRLAKFLDKFFHKVGLEIAFTTHLKTDRLNEEFLAILEEIRTRTLKKHPQLIKMITEGRIIPKPFESILGAFLSVLEPINEYKSDQDCYGCDTTIKILDIKEKDDYIVLKTLQDGSEFGSKNFEMDTAYAYTGCSIGDEKFAKFLSKEGIIPESPPGCNVCAIGWCAASQKYYGWSHRAMFGFKEGDKIFDMKCKDCNDRTHFSKYGTQTVKSIVDARKAAINFARYVS